MCWFLKRREELLSFTAHPVKEHCVHMEQETACKNICLYPQFLHDNPVTFSFSSNCCIVYGARGKMFMLPWEVHPSASTWVFEASCPGGGGRVQRIAVLSCCLSFLGAGAGHC